MGLCAPHLALSRAARVWRRARVAPGCACDGAPGDGVSMGDTGYGVVPRARRAGLCLRWRTAHVHLTVVAAGSGTHATASLALTQAVR